MLLSDSLPKQFHHTACGRESHSSCKPLSVLSPLSFGREPVTPLRRPLEEVLPTRFPEMLAFSLQGETPAYSSPRWDARKPASLALRSQAPRGRIRPAPLSLAPDGKDAPKCPPPQGTPDSAQAPAAARSQRHPHRADGGRFERLRTRTYVYDKLEGRGPAASAI